MSSVLLYEARFSQKMGVQSAHINMGPEQPKNFLSWKMKLSNVLINVGQGKFFCYIISLPNMHLQLLGLLWSTLYIKLRDFNTRYLVCVFFCTSNNALSNLKTRYLMYKVIVHQITRLQIWSRGKNCVNLFWHLYTRFRPPKSHKLVSEKIHTVFTVTSGPKSCYLMSIMIIHQKMQIHT